MEREKYAETSSKAIENILKLNKKPWKLYVPLHKKQQLQEQSACCIGIQVKCREKFFYFCRNLSLLLKKYLFRHY